mmetsp:Transcript_56673/g.113524  ORF Transcript_56673/g.113524 Transcript_56673/m.113524 type:complete len:353 (-) Transcript_56673:25-1083(-)
MSSTAALDWIKLPVASSVLNACPSSSLVSGRPFFCLPLLSLLSSSLSSSYCPPPLAGSCSCCFCCLRRFCCDDQGNGFTTNEMSSSCSPSIASRSRAISLALRPPVTRLPASCRCPLPPNNGGRSNSTRRRIDCFECTSWAWCPSSETFFSASTTLPARLPSKPPSSTSSSSLSSSPSPSTPSPTLLELFNCSCRCCSACGCPACWCPVRLCPAFRLRTLGVGGGVDGLPPPLLFNPPLLLNRFSFALAWATRCFLRATAMVELSRAVRFASRIRRRAKVVKGRYTTRTHSSSTAALPADGEDDDDDSALLDRLRRRCKERGGSPWAVWKSWRWCMSRESRDSNVSHRKSTA